MARGDDLNRRLLDFAITIAAVVKSIPQDVVGSHVAHQLVRAGTAPAAHHSEAQSAESKRDFIHKMKMGLKELRETQMWLQIVSRSELGTHSTKATLAECQELIAIFAASIRTANSAIKQENNKTIKQ